MSIPHGRARVCFAVPAILGMLASACSTSTPAATLMTPPSPVTTSPPIGSMSIIVNGDVRYVPLTATVGVALKEIGLKPKAGRLLDVRGDVLRTQAYPAHVLVDGKRAKNQTPLVAGDAVQVMNGKDHIEDTVQTRVQVAPEPTNPQTKLGVAPGYEVTTTGKVSGKVASVVFNPTGKVRSPKAIALTFDDGPNPTYTPKVLKVLRHFHVPATFFVIGYEAQKYPDLVKKEVAQGNVVGSHSWSHPTPFTSLDDRQLQRQFSLANDELAKVGVQPFLFKPPGGAYDAKTLEEARRYGMRTVLWSVDTHDYTGRSAKDISSYVLKHIFPGAIVLMHDGGGDRSATVKALPDIIRGARKRGYDLVAITQPGL